MAIKIASYNLWEGSRNTYFRFIDFVKEQNFDVLCLQEINGWQDNGFAKLNDFSDRAGFTGYEYGNSNSEYKLATMSMLPIVSKTVHQEGYWHCVVEVHVKIGETELVIFNLHLDPWKEDPRVLEIDRLLKKVDPSKPTIITGDFNSLSKQDNYSPEFLAMLQKRKFYKFGQDALDYRVTDKLAEAGFVDIAAKLAHLEVTAPTQLGITEASNEDMPVSEMPARIDYVFANNNAVPMITDYAVIKNEETDKISDHYPIVVTLDFEKPQTPASLQAAMSEEPAQPSTPPPGPVPAATPPTEPPATKNTDTEGELIIKHDKSED
jgi:exodeoxyribonuclease-3